MDVSGINLYSLRDRTGGEGIHCVALILSTTDHHWAKLLNGRDVTVSGIVIGAGDLDAILPERDGEINGRFWGGTNCQGALVIFVKRFGR